MSSQYRSIAIAGGDTARPHAMHKRLRLIQAHLVPDRRRFLDCGCGAGEYVFELIGRFGLDAHGIEYEAEKVREAQRHPAHGSRISRGDLQAIESDPEQWDYAMLNEVLEHVPDESQTLREVHRVLRPGGVLFVFSPNRWFPFETHGVHLKGARRRVPHWMPFVPYVPLALGNRVFDYWARNYWQGELRQLVRSAGFTVLETGFVWQTFEGISGRQPNLIRSLKPVLRRVADACEALPVVQRFGVSQALVCRK